MNANILCKLASPATLRSMIADIDNNRRATARPDFLQIERNLLVRLLEFNVGSVNCRALGV